MKRIGGERIERFCIVKDGCGRGIYGGGGGKGVMLIRRKWGGENEGREIKVSVEKGLNVMRKLGELVEGGRWMRM